MNKKGQLASMILVFIIIFIVAVLFFFLNNLNERIYGEFEDFFVESDKYNQTEAQQAITDIRNVEQSNIWDYAFLAIAVGLIIQMVVLSFATRISNVFYWIYILASLFIFALGIITSNIWQEIAAQPVFAETLTRFPITDALLGTYYPSFFIAILLIVIIAVFGKPRQEVLVQ